MQQFDNYVFDLYGTLVDIHTDENQPHLWVHMADLYRVYGADWTAEELERAFRAYEKEAREKQAERMGTAYPEIQYEDLLIRCLKSAPRTHETAMPISARASEAAIRAAFWPEFMANDFRAVSRSRFLLYPGTLETLRELKARGRRLYLLSNAQAVFTLPEMEMMGLAPLFDRMHMSSWDGMMKPEPRYLRRLLEEEGLEALCEELKERDPEHYAIVDRQNPRRVVHALEICLMTGNTYTSYRKAERKQRPFRIIKIGLNRPREELYQRINSRVDQMMEQGLLEEARQLYPVRHTNALNTVGYKELFSYMDGVWPLDEAVERIKGNTRRYARKQLTWFKKDPAVIWVDADDRTAVSNLISRHSQ